MLYVVSEEHAMLQESAAAFFASIDVQQRHRAFRETDSGFDPASWKSMAEMGWLSLRLPEQLGGLGLGLDAAAVLAKQLGAAAVAEPFVAMCLMPSVILAHAGNGAKANALAEDLGAGNRPLTLATGDAPIDLEAASAGQGVRVENWAPGCAVLVLTYKDDAPAILALDAEHLEVVSPARRLSDGTATAYLKSGKRAIALEDILLSGEHALNAWARAHDEGAIALCAQLSGLGRGALDVTMKYIEQRVQFGKAIASFQVIQHKIVDLSIALQLAESSYRAALRAYCDGADHRPAMHAAKARCSDVALDIARGAVQLHGAIGYTDECDVAAYLRSALHLSQSLGNSAYHRQAFWRLTAASGARHG